MVWCETDGQAYWEGAYEWVHTNAKQSAIVPDVRVLEKDNKKVSIIRSANNLSDDGCESHSDEMRREYNLRFTYSSDSLLIPALQTVPPLPLLRLLLLSLLRGLISVNPPPPPFAISALS